MLYWVEIQFDIDTEFNGGHWYAWTIGSTSLTPVVQITTLKGTNKLALQSFFFQSSVYTCICTISSIIRLNQWNNKIFDWLKHPNGLFFCILMYAVNPTIFFSKLTKLKMWFNIPCFFINPKSVIFLSVTLILIMNFYIYIDASFHVNLYEINRSMWR